MCTFYTERFEQQKKIFKQKVHSVSWDYVGYWDGNKFEKDETSSKTLPVKSRSCISFYVEGSGHQNTIIFRFLLLDFLKRWNIWKFHIYNAVEIITSVPTNGTHDGNFLVLIKHFKRGCSKLFGGCVWKILVTCTVSVYTRSSRALYLYLPYSPLFLPGRELNPVRLRCRMGIPCWPWGAHGGHAAIGSVTRMHLVFDT